MNNKLKKTVIVLGLATFSVGLMTSLSSFGVKTTAAVLDTCYDQQNISDCPATTSSTLTVNGTATTAFTITVGTSPSTITVSGVGFSVSFPKKTGTSSTTVTGTNGYSYTFSETVTSGGYETFCNLRTSAGGYACAQVNCQKIAVQTWTCAHPGPGTGTGTGSSASAVAW
jgi:hypothetical protein